MEREKMAKSKQKTKRAELQFDSYNRFDVVRALCYTKSINSCQYLFE